MESNGKQRGKFNGHLDDGGFWQTGSPGSLLIDMGCRRVRRDSMRNHRG